MYFLKRISVRIHKPLSDILPLLKNYAIYKYYIIINYYIKRLLPWHKYPHK